MAILFSGDFHANAVGELSHITKKKLVALHGQRSFDAIRYHIILGDGGFLWPGNRKTDAYNFKVLSHRPFPVLCVIGNHEPMLGMMDDLGEADIGIGERVYKINANPFVAYLKRGKVYTIEGFKFLALGGALSIDAYRRTPGISWWEREYWTEEEKAELYKLLRKDSSFDFVLAHTGPNSINWKLFQHDADSADKFSDHVAFLNDTVDSMISCKQWWCGHWHQDKYYYDEHKKRGYRYLYYNTMILDRESDQIVIQGSGFT
jgi:3-oxoacid CoA-transferase subunit A